MNFTYHHGFWLFFIFALFFGMMGRLESTTAKPQLRPTVERIPASDRDLRFK